MQADPQEVPVARAQKPRRPPGLSAAEAAVVDALDDVREELRLLREMSVSPKQFLAACVLAALMFFASQVYMVSLIAESRGVDSGRAANATKTVGDLVPSTAPAGGE